MTFTFVSFMLMYAHVLVLHWANLVLVPSGMVHLNH